MYFDNTISVRFNFQKWLRVGIEDGDLERISVCLGVGIEELSAMIKKFDEINNTAAEELLRHASLDGIAGKKTKIGFVGDSITSDRMSYMNILKCVFQNNSEIELCDFAVSGWRTADIIENFTTNILDYNCDIVVMMIGTNDLRTVALEQEINVTGREEYARNLGFILGELAQRKIRTILITISPTQQERVDATYGDSKWLFKTEDWNSYNEIVREKAQEYNAELCEMSFHYKNAGLDEIMFEDGIHINEKGQKLIAEQLFPILKNITEEI